MKKLHFLFIAFAITVFAIPLKGQNNKEKVRPYLNTGYGYFSDEFILNGTVLSSELGIIMENNYIFSLKIHSASTLNSKGEHFDIPNADLNFIYSYKWGSLNMGYNFETKNTKHAIVPQLGIYYGEELITYPLINNETLVIKDDMTPMIGVEVSLQYMYNFKNGISLGVNTSGCLAYDYGPTYFTATPVIAFKLN